MNEERRRIRYVVNKPRSVMMRDDLDLVKMIRSDLENSKNDELGKLLTETGDKWIAVREVLSNIQNSDGSVEFCIDLEVKRDIIERIYVPVYNQVQIPNDTHFCSYCGGYTRNDKYRGHCAACGAPRIK